MNKDAFYFPHFSNARHDRKLKRVIKELGVEGYGIYFMILEVLRDQDGFQYPIEDIDLLADEFNTTEAKVRTVVCNYKLFSVDENQNFFSVKFNEYLTPYIESKEQSRISGIKGNLIRYKYLTKERASLMTNDEILKFDEMRRAGDLRKLSGGESGGESGGDRYKSKEKKSKTNESKTNESKEEYTGLSFVTPTVGIAPGSDSNFKRVINSYQQNIQGNVPQVVVQSIINWMTTFDEDMMVRAIEITAKKQATFNYMEAILNNWQTKGYTTLADVDNDHKGKKKESTGNPFLDLMQEEFGDE